jgi:hypothetical protein
MRICNNAELGKKPKRTLPCNWPRLHFTVMTKPLQREQDHYCKPGKQEALPTAKFKMHFNRLKKHAKIH